MKISRTNAALSVLTGLALLVPATSFAAKFANQFTEFELPPQWQCNLEGAEWVCQSAVEGKKRDAIIVLAAKLKGDQDSLDQYLAYLKGAKAFTSVQGKPIKSDVKYAKNANLNGQPWVDALHLESEIPGFYTRYLATVQKDIGVLITYSINKNKYQDYLADFDNLVRTLKVFRKTGGINVAPSDKNLFAGSAIPNAVSNGTFDPSGIGAGDPAAPVKPAEKGLPLPLLALGGAAVLFFIWKKKQSAG